MLDEMLIAGELQEPSKKVSLQSGQMWLRSVFIVFAIPFFMTVAVLGPLLIVNINQPHLSPFQLCACPHAASMHCIALSFTFRAPMIDALAMHCISWPRRICLFPTLQ